MSDQPILVRPDYTSPGAYFVTLCVRDGECLLDVVDGEMRLNRAGQLVQREWERLPRRFPHVQLDAFVVMPNHVHGIIIITDDTGRGTAGRADTRATDQPAVPLPPQHEQFGKPVPGSLPTIVRSYKAATALRINIGRGTSGASVWQRNYYEHIVRNDAALERIRAYIVNNPARWTEDQLHPAAPPNPFNRRRT